MIFNNFAMSRAVRFCRMASSVGGTAAKLPKEWASWAKVDVPAATGIQKPLLAAVPPGRLPRMAACGWLSVGAADAMGVALVVFRGVDNFQDFVEKPGANVVQAVSREASRLGISEGMAGEEALSLLETADATAEEKVLHESVPAPQGKPCQSHELLDTWTTAELPVSTGLPKPLLVAVPPGGKPRMAACGWVDHETANKLDVSLAVFKGVNNFHDFVEEAAATSNVVKIASEAAEKMGIAEGLTGKDALTKLAE